MPRRWQLLHQESWRHTHLFNWHKCHTVACFAVRVIPTMLKKLHRLVRPTSCKICRLATVVRRHRAMKALISILLLITLLGCSPAGESDEDTVNIGTLRKELQMPVPAFQIQITLSETAAKKMSDAGESVAGCIIFDGDGRKKHNEHTAPERDVPLGYYEFERKFDGVLYITNATIAKEAFERLTNPDYFFTVNVYSGRHVFENNILDDGYAEGHISDAVKSPVQIKCDLLTSK